MSYTEYMRRKAAAAPVVINNQKLRTASELTQERRLMASAVFPTNGQDDGTMRGDLLLTSTSVNPKQPTSFVKQTGKPKNASDFTSFLGSHAIQNGNTFANGNTQNAGKLKVDGACYNTITHPVLNPSITPTLTNFGTFNSGTLNIPAPTSISYTTTTGNYIITTANAVTDGTTVYVGSTQNAGLSENTAYIIVYIANALVFQLKNSSSGATITFSSGQPLTLYSNSSNVQIASSNGYDPAKYTLSITATITSVGAGNAYFDLGTATIQNKFFFGAASLYWYTNAGASGFIGPPKFFPTLDNTGSPPTVANGDVINITVNSSKIVYTYTTSGGTSLVGTYPSSDLLTRTVIFSMGGYNPGNYAGTTPWTFSNISFTVQQNDNDTHISEPVPYITGSTGQVKANTVARSGSDYIRERLACQKAQGEQHIQSELGPSVFKDDTISRPHFNKQYLSGAKTCGPNDMFPKVEHTHSTTVNRQAWSARPTKSNIPVYGLPVLDHIPTGAPQLPNCFTGKNTTGVFSRGGILPKDMTRYVEKHHGNDLLSVNPRKPVPAKYQIPAGTPAHLKINDTTLIKTPNM